MAALGAEEALEVAGQGLQRAAARVVTAGQAVRVPLEAQARLEEALVVRAADSVLLGVVPVVQAAE